jgi:1-acyl-sn-glycerol-3-phosphate acyltransferase
MLVHFVYRLDKRGLEHIPDDGPALLVCNHVSYADALVISAACRRPIRFIMEAGIFKVPVLSSIFRGMKAIPVAPAKEDPQTYQRAFDVVAELRDGNLVCIFPEGRLTADGDIGDFRPGMMRILKETPVPVVPLALSGLWHSVFSRKEKLFWRRWPKGIWPKIAIRVGTPVDAPRATPEQMRAHVVTLRGAWQ